MTRPTITRTPGDNKGSALSYIADGLQLQRRALAMASASMPDRHSTVPVLQQVSRTERTCVLAKQSEQQVL